MDKYSAQKKHIKENYKRLPVNLRTEEMELFKERCKANGTTPSAVVKQAIADYMEKTK